MNTEPDDGDEEYEERGWDFDEMLNGDQFGHDFPELPDECTAAVERSLVRFETSNLCGVIAEDGKIVTHFEAICQELQRAMEAGRLSSLAVEVDERKVFCSPESICDRCGLALLGPPHDRPHAEVEQYELAVSRVAQLTFSSFGDTGGIPVRILCNDRRWIRGWQIGGDGFNRLIVESSLKPSDVGCPVIDEDGDLVRMVETEDVVNWILHE